ncbi:MAG: hypothetical protein ACYC3X_25495 [Pirellulaceae bacterium]
MNAQTQEVRDATNAVDTVLKRLEEVRCLVDRNGLDDHHHLLGPMLTDYVAVVFAAFSVVEKAADSLRRVSPDIPQSVGPHTEPSYHELAMRLAEEPIWLVGEFGMNEPGKRVLSNMLVGYEDRPAGSIAEIKCALRDMGCVADPAAAIAAMRELELSGFDMEWLRSCVRKEGSRALNTVERAAGDNPNTPPQSPVVTAYLGLAIDGQVFTRGQRRITLLGNAHKLVSALHAAGANGLSRDEAFNAVFGTASSNSLDQLKRTVNKELAKIGLQLTSPSRGIWQLAEKPE